MASSPIPVHLHEFPFITITTTTITVAACPRPTCPALPQADVWCKYAELELGGGNMSGLKAIFQRCLMQVPSLELWALYIKFIRRSNKSEGALRGGTLCMDV